MLALLDRRNTWARMVQSDPYTEDSTRLLTDETEAWAIHLDEQRRDRLEWTDDDEQRQRLDPTTNDDTTTTTTTQHSHVTVIKPLVGLPLSNKFHLATYETESIKILKSI